MAQQHWEVEFKKLLECIFSSYQDGDIDCQSCCEQFDCLAEMAASGAAPKDMLPAVEAHLSYCRDCRELYEAVVAVIRAEQMAEQGAGGTAPNSAKDTPASGH
jgi:hypothetical protein